MLDKVIEFIVQVLRGKPLFVIIKIPFFLTFQEGIIAADCYCDLIVDE